MKKLTLATLVGALFTSVAAIPAAQAATTAIAFDTNGAAGGGLISVSTFDWSPDNALAVGATPLANFPATTSFDLYAQGRLGNFLDSGGDAILGTGLGSTFEITFEAGFSELGTNAVIPGLGAFASFTLDPAASVNFFNIYYDTAMNVDQAAGTGYGDGTLILSAVALSNSTGFSVLFTTDTNGDTILDAPTIVNLDNNGAVNNTPGVGTVVGQGGGQLEAAVTFAHADFFKSSFSSFLVDLFFNTSNVTPFNQAEPALLVVGNTPEYGAPIPGFPNGVNGLGNGNTCQLCDFQFQADANQSFQAVPEPSSLALLGGALGIAGLMGWGRRRKIA